jgi:hypothetical protein
MPDYQIAAGGYGTPKFALVAGQVSTVTFAEDISTLEVYTDGTAEVWWTADGSTPNAATGHGYFLPAFPSAEDREPPTGGATVIKLVSTGTPMVRVGRV